MHQNPNESYTGRAAECNTNVVNECDVVEQKYRHRKLPRIFLPIAQTWASKRLSSAPLATGMKASFRMASVARWRTSGLAWKMASDTMGITVLARASSSPTASGSRSQHSLNDSPNRHRRSSQSPVREVAKTLNNDKKMQEINFYGIGTIFTHDKAEKRTKHRIHTG